METNVARRQDDVEHCTSVCTSLSCISILYIDDTFWTSDTLSTSMS